jgi:hypothetical protein
MQVDRGKVEERFLSSGVMQHHNALKWSLLCMWQTLLCCVMLWHVSGVSWQDLEEREARRAAAAKDSQWQQFIAASRPHVSTQVRQSVDCCSSVWS